MLGKIMQHWLDKLSGNKYKYAELEGDIDYLNKAVEKLISVNNELSTRVLTLEDKTKWLKKELFNGSDMKKSKHAHKKDKS